MVCSKCRDVTYLKQCRLLQANGCVVIEGSIVVKVKGSELNKNGSSRRFSITACHRQRVPAESFEWLVKEAGSGKELICAVSTEVTRVTTLVEFCICLSSSDVLC
jgi:hypothetical protein